MTTTQIQGTKNSVATGNNPKYIYVRTSNGTVQKPNPNYDPNKCPKCGGRKGFFHSC